VLSEGSGFYVDGAVSRFKKTGQRAFRANGRNFPLGIPLTVTITPLELSLGYRFRTSPGVFPYVGVGVGSYGYKETSDSSDAGENVDTRHSGYIAVGGAEVRVHRLVGVAGDVQYTRVPGILGNGGISKDVGENDLGGITIRLRVTFGR
jgi:opacity protein-like surface antigen